MGSFHLARMSMRNLFSKPATRRYPTEAPSFAPMTKGHVVNDIALCILCGICVKKCPADALVVDKPAGTWAIDPFACVQCYTCVRACPKDSLSMLPDYTKAAVGKSVHVEKKPQQPETKKG
ncbi:MAG: 4Fe-4S binding protein [Coriobacteriales bacterium]|jgi:formate hydrogenlyase subunit 6/NADH:ubiquinone oxidoreductase subunit I|nr:4Fe-4S binding protein [Coriobacteriales bacterium]